MKHIELWNKARKLKLGSKFLEDLDTLLTSLENENKQLTLTNVVVNEAIEDLPTITMKLNKPVIYKVSNLEHGSEVELFCDCYIKYPRGDGDCRRCGLPAKP